MLKRLVDVAAGRVKADVVLKNGSFVNVFTGETEKGDIAVAGDRIAGIGDYAGEKEFDVAGMVVLPGLIDGHVHIESSQLSPEEFARLVVPRGPPALIAHPPHIRNRCGRAGGA